MFWISLAAIVMSFIAFKLGVVTVLASVLLLVLKAIFAAFVLVAGFFGWRSYRNRKPKQLPGENYEINRQRVDELSRYILARQIRSKHADGVTAVTTRLLTPFKDKCHTITFDNGKEFAEHERIVAELQTSIYCAHPYHSWERGLNETSNGLLRQYFPKSMELTDITEEQVQWVVERLYHRPRKVLGFRSPHELLFGVEMCYTKPPLVVALRT